MSLPERKRVTPASLAVDAMLGSVFFAILFGLLRSHVPSHDPKMIAFWAGLTAACMTAVFWLAIQMFRVVLRAEREARTRNRCLETAVETTDFLRSGAAIKGILLNHETHEPHEIGKEILPRRDAKWREHRIGED